MDNPFLLVTMRYLHIASAIVAVGGTTFLALCLSPAMRLVDDTFRDSLMKLVSQRFTRVLWVCIGGLVVSGVFNWVRLMPVYKDMGPVANALIGVKVLLALILFGLIWARSIGLVKLKLRAYLMITVHLAAIIILLASVLRHLRDVSG